ncbi:MAG: TRAP transporter small permease subunit [Desulfobacterales bacterium]|jgi:TRAP-type mannitol/chloroaromatic compound transport system permease small subunit|nr:TRAP transporter small permease subunit [Desulfobacterales bacterium]
MFQLDTIDKINRWIGKMVSIFVLLIMSITLLEVVLRYGFNRPTMWVHETSQQIFAIAFLLGSAYTLQEGGHVRVDILYRRLSTKGRAILEIVTSILYFLFNGVLLWKGGEMAYESVMMLEKTQTPWEPYVFHVILAIPIAAALMLLQGIVDFIRNLKTLANGDRS